MDFDEDAARKETLLLIEEQQQLKNLKDNSDVVALFDNQLKIVSQKMVYAFTTGKDGDNIKNWNDFCIVRGEIVARLQPIQAIYGAEATMAYLTDQLKTMFTETE